MFPSRYCRGEGYAPPPPGGSCNITCYGRCIFALILREGSFNDLIFAVFLCRLMISAKKNVRDCQKYFVVDGPPYENYFSIL